MTTLQEMGEQPLTPDSLVPIMLKSAEGWDQMAAFVALTIQAGLLQRHPAANSPPRPEILNEGRV